MMMSRIESRAWYYNDTKHIGIDYSTDEEVQFYENEFGEKADRYDEIKELIEALSLSATSVVLDIGTATGPLAIELAKQCKQVYGIDVSEGMLQCARSKAEKLALDNVEFIHSSFLSHQFEDNSLDAVFTKYALHHLPDHWKFVALKRIFALLKPGGRFFLKDAILFIKIHDFYDFADEWVSSATEAYGERGTEAALLYIRDEYPTYVWIIERMLKEVGFNIEKMETIDKMHTTFICAKPLAQ